MGLIDIMNVEPTPARRTARLAKEMGALRDSFENGTLSPKSSESNIYEKLTMLMCWDASLLCAWAVNGISCDEIDRNCFYIKGYGVVTAHRYDRLFPDLILNNPSHQITNAVQMMQLPVGCFVGFIDTDKALKHVMIHWHKGMGAGTKNACIFRGVASGFINLDMTDFFLKENFKPGIKVVFNRITGQKL